MDPALEFFNILLTQGDVEVGWREGRDPNPDFSTSYYLSANVDVRDAGINPLYHYLTVGRGEGRRPVRPGGFRARVLETLQPLEREVLAWRRPTAPPQSLLGPEAIESDLLIYVNINLVAMDGGNKAIPIGLGTYKSVRHHHNVAPERGRHDPSMGDGGYWFATGEAGTSERTARRAASSGWA